MKQKQYFYDAAGDMIGVIETSSEEDGGSQAAREAGAEVVDFRSRAKVTSSAEQAAAPAEAEPRRANG